MEFTLFGVNKIMEKELFDWKEWDLIDTACFAFYQVTLKVPIDRFPIGTQFEIANIDYEEGKVEFINFEKDGRPNYQGIFELKSPAVKPGLFLGTSCWICCII